MPFSALLLLAACDASDNPGTEEPASDTGNGDIAGGNAQERGSAPPADAATPTGGMTANGVNDGIPDLTPPPLTPEAQRTETGARSVLVNWARAIELQEWDQAWRMMSDADRARWDREDFAALFSDLADVTVAVPSGSMEGTDASSYYRAPVTVTGRDGEGRPMRYEGEVVLRRANDVAGPGDEQTGWHIESVTLDWTH
ncbi:MAG: hypothetical protein WBA68_11645 [Alteraurantiacibacter sp.]